MFEKASDLKIEAPMKVLFFGQSGSGKTFAAALLDNCLHIVWERQGLLSVKTANPEAFVFVVNDTGNRTPDEQIERINACLAELNESEHPEIQSVVLDSLSEAYEVYLQHEMEKRGRLKPTFDEYGAANYMVRKLVKTLRDLNKNVVLISLSKEVITDTNEMRIKAGLTESLSDYVYKSVNVAGYLYTEQADDGSIHRLVRLEHSDNLRVKKHPALDAIERPNLQKWINKVGAWLLKGDSMHSTLDDEPVLQPALEPVPKEVTAELVLKKPARRKRVVKQLEAN